MRNVKKRKLGFWYVDFLLYFTGHREYTNLATIKEKTFGLYIFTLLGQFSYPFETIPLF